MKFLDKWANLLFFSELLCIGLEAYFEWLIAGVLNHNAKQISSHGRRLFSQDGEEVANIVGYVSIAVTLVIIPALLVYVFTRELFEYQTEKFNKNWSYIFKDIKTDSKFSSSYFVLYIARRIIFVLLVFYSVNVPTY